MASIVVAKLGRCKKSVILPNGVGAHFGQAGAWQTDGDCIDFAEVGRKFRSLQRTIRQIAVRRGKLIVVMAHRPILCPRELKLLQFGCWVQCRPWGRSASANGTIGTSSFNSSLGGERRDSRENR